MSKSMRFGRGFLAAIAVVLLISICGGTVFGISFVSSQQEENEGDIHYSEVGEQAEVQDAEDDPRLKSSDDQETIPTDGIDWPDWIERVQRISPDFLQHAVHEISNLTDSEKDQVITAWTENVFDMASPNRTLEVFCSETGLSKETALVLLLANLEMGMRYIEKHFDGDQLYLERFLSAYVHLYDGMSVAMSNSVVENADEYVDDLSKTFAQEFEEVIKINWEEQENESNPRIVFWGYAYYEGQSSEDVDECLTVFADLKGNG